VGAALGWSADRAMMSSADAAVPGSASTKQAVEAPRPLSAIHAGRQSLDLAIPEDRAYVTSSSIVVAGTAFSRPHGPRIRTVQVELYVSGRLVERADLEVFSSRFAGVLELSTPIGRTDAELRVSDPSHPARPIVVRHLTIDSPARPLGPTG
jgi:hypothetical protein